MNDGTAPFARKAKEKLSRRYEILFTSEQWDRLKATAGPNGDVSDIVRGLVDRFVGRRQALADSITTLKTNLLRDEAELDAIDRDEEAKAKAEAEKAEADARETHKKEIVRKMSGFGKKRFWESNFGEKHDDWEFKLKEYGEMTADDRRTFREAVEAMPKTD